jgi:pantothenate kinase-related protein Tda10
MGCHHAVVERLQLRLIDRYRELPIKKDSRKFAVAISGARTAGGTTTAEVLGPMGPILAVGRHFHGEES